MKKLFIFVVITLTIAACTTEVNVPYEGGNIPQSINMSPVKKAEYNIYTNGTTIFNNVPKAARATRVAASEGSFDGIITYEPIQTTKIDRNAEKELCEEVLPEQNGNIDALTTDFLYYAKDGDIEMELYPVYGMSDKCHDLGIFYYDAAGEMHKQIIWSQMNPWADYTSSEWTWSQELGSYEIVRSKGIKVTVKKGYKFGFYWNGYLNWNDYENNGITDGNGAVTYYTEDALNPIVYCTNGGGNKISDNSTSKKHAATFTRNGCTYLGIEDWTDFDYQDIVFKCKSTVPTVNSKDKLPVETTTDPEPTTPDPSVPTDPTPFDPTPAVVIGDSIELNLSINDAHEKGDWIQSKLSIHVRTVTDVEVFLPVPAEYYCEADDMYIVENRRGLVAYNTEVERVTLTICGHEVLLNVTYSPEGITVKSEGINEDIINYLKGQYDDGVTFEIYNYYRNETASGTPITRAMIQEMLNKSTVTTTKPISKIVCTNRNHIYTPEYWNDCTIKPTDASYVLQSRTDTDEHYTYKRQ